MTPGVDGETPRIGISRCLLGDEVRYDGGHKRDAFLVSTFGRFVEWVPVCPEVEVGMGTPREAVHLVSDGGVTRMIAVKSRREWTTEMNAFSSLRVRQLASMRLSGYVLKKDSPSCGMARVRLHGAAGVTRAGRGLFAAALLDTLPTLPVEEEGRLNDPILRENFVERVFAFQRLRDLLERRWSPAALVRFHTAHKLQLLSHSRQGYRELGALVAGAGRISREQARDYERLFMATLAKPATRGRHADVLMHMYGHLKRLLDEGDRHELVATIEEHRHGVVPLVVPVTLLRHHARRHSVGYLLGQTYLEPHPRELALRNHV
jgi:uncharacterized protein YbgA (DUF1722 family)/uncharacterized protein YbbK (DUF523 family)